VKAVNKKRSVHITGLILFHISTAITLSEIALESEEIDHASIRDHLKTGAEESGSVLERAIWETHSDMYDEDLVDQISGSVNPELDPEIWSRDS